MRARRTCAARLAAALLATALLAGCGDDGDDAASTTTSEAGPTTEASTTEAPTTEGTTATTGGTTATTAPVDLGDAPAFSESGPSGSGCTPGAGALPDGWWYGVSVASGADGYTFDLACYYVGAAAEAVAAERGDEVNNDYYVVNDNPALRTVPLAAGATATCVELGAGVVQADCSPADIPDPEVPWAVWFRVVDGEVDRLVEQYAP